MASFFELRVAGNIYWRACLYFTDFVNEQHESVPTWNYIAVHAYGLPKALLPSTIRPELMGEMINDMVDDYEADYKSHLAKFIE